MLDSIPTSHETRDFARRIRKPARHASLAILARSLLVGTSQTVAMQAVCLIA